MNQHFFFKKVFPLVFSFMLIFNSCIKDTISEIGNINGIEVDPSVSVPLMNAHLGIKDIYNSYSNKAQIVEGSDKFLTFVYESDASLSPKQFVTFPPINVGYTFTMNQAAINQFNATGYFASSYSNTTVITTNNKERLRNVSVKNGNFSITITSTFKHNGYAVFNYPTIIKNGVSLVDTILFNYTGTSPLVITKQIDLSGSNIDLTNSGVSYNIIPYSISVNMTKIAGNPVSTSDQLIFNEQLNIPEYNFMQGYLGKFTMLVDSAYERLDIFKKNADGSIFINDPKVRLKILNGIGLPITAKFSYLNILSGKGINYPVSIDLFKDTFTFTYPTISQQGQIIESDYLIDKTNSNIDSIFSYSPQALMYYLTFTANYNEDVTLNNFILGSNNIFSSTETTELPLEIKIYSYQLQSIDTISWYTLPDGVSINTVKISGWYQNSFPLGTTVQIYFAKDSVINGIDSISVLDSLYTNPFYISGAVVDANGKLLQPSVITNNVSMDISKYNRLKATATKTFIVANARTSDYNGAFPFVKIYSDQGLNFKIGVEANGKYKLKMK